MLPKDAIPIPMSMDDWYDVQYNDFSTKCPGNFPFTVITHDGVIMGCMNEPVLKDDCWEIIGPAIPLCGCDNGFNWKESLIVSPTLKN